MHDVVQVGFCTVYNYYAWPDRKRLRLSQILVFPPFQRQGIGQLLRACGTLEDLLLSRLSVSGGTLALMRKLDICVTDLGQRIDRRPDLLSETPISAWAWPSTPAPAVRGGGRRR